MPVPPIGARGSSAMKCGEALALGGVASTNQSLPQRGTLASAQTSTEIATRFFGPERAPP